MSTQTLCDLCREPIRSKADHIKAEFASETRNNERVDFHRECLAQKMPGLWVLES